MNFPAFDEIQTLAETYLRTCLKMGSLEAPRGRAAFSLAPWKACGRAGCRLGDGLVLTHTRLTGSMNLLRRTEWELFLTCGGRLFLLIDLERLNPAVSSWIFQSENLMHPAVLEKSASWQRLLLHGMRAALDRDTRGGEIRMGKTRVAAGGGSRQPERQYVRHSASPHHPGSRGGAIPPGGAFQ